MEVAMFDELSSEDEKKKWLFKENVRLQELSRNLEDEKTHRDSDGNASETAE